MYVFEVKESIFEGFEKNTTFHFFRKVLFYVRLSREGAFVTIRKTSSFDVL